MMNAFTFDRTTGSFLRNGGPIPVSSEQKDEMQRLRWWHEFDFGGGVVTQSHHSPWKKNLPELFFIDQVDFREKSVLDIGAADGFYSFFTEAKGAARNVLLDDLTQFGRTNRPLHFTKEILGSHAEFLDMSLYNLSPRVHGTFDVVMMFGVLYHLVHPMLGIEKACSVCKSEFLLETHFLQTDTDVPVYVLYPDNEYADDYSNWAGPNIPWILQALWINGFQTKSIHEVDPQRVAVHAVRVQNHHTTSRILNAHRDTTLFGLGENVEPDFSWDKPSFKSKRIV